MSGPQLKSKFFQAAFAELHVTLLTTMRCYPRTDELLERYNSAIIS